jgi:hypothetical protein
MGFSLKNLSIKGIGNFISGNVKSTINDGAHLVQQYINNPVTKTLAPIALSAVGVPPQVAGAVNNLQNKALNKLQGVQQGGSPSQDSVANITDDSDITDAKQKQAQALKEIDEKRRIQEEAIKKENKKIILYISGAVVLTTTISIIAYKLIKKKN